MNEIDQQLLQRYTRDRAEDAFAELVRRHLNLVYSAALRQVQSPQLARDVAQSVFNDLARGAAHLKQNTVLSAWLYEVTRRTAIDLIRQETRRKAREQAYTEMNAFPVATDENWREILPHLDAAMEELENADRAAVLLRFFENKSLREVGEELGVSDEAARKRIARAVERLRKTLSARGVAVGSGALILLVTANALHAAPAGLAASIAGTAFASASVSALTATTGVEKLIGKGALQKTLIVATAGALTIAVILVVSHSSGRGKSPSPVSTSIPATTANALAAPVAGNPESIAPDPVQLLKGVLRARQQIQSGTLEFEDAVDRFKNGQKDPRQYRFVASFDGAKLRFESSGHEYAYKYDEDEEKQDDIRKKADSMDTQSAVRAGWLEESTSHHTLVSDGTAVYDHFQSSSQMAGVTIRALTNFGGGFIFDPRSIGLSTYLSVRISLEDYLPRKDVELVGEEEVDGITTYHIRVKGGGLDYWLDKARPERLLQVGSGNEVAKSKYNASYPGDPIPDEVDTTHFRNGVLTDDSRLVCTLKSYNTPIDAESFTLAGMGLAVGTDVNDDRIYRRIGYWTGSGLSEGLPGKMGAAQPASRLDEMLAVLETEPSSTNALQCATWIILNTPDGDAVQKAADVILREHVADTNLVQFCQELARVRPSCSKALLTGLLGKNPSLEVRGNACFTLATISKDAAKYGQNKEATAQAIEKYQQVVTEFSSVKQRGYSLADLAKPELNELQNLIIGKPAPDTEGVDMNGQPLKLSTYRGRVTVVVFWASYFTEALWFQKFNEEMTGKPFALIGVNCDDESSKKEEYVKKVTWPCFKDGRQGPISKLWNVNSWTDTWILDRNGVIRYRNLRGSEIRDAVNKLLAE